MVWQGTAERAGINALGFGSSKRGHEEQENGVKVL